MPFPLPMNPAVTPLPMALRSSLRRKLIGRLFSAAVVSAGLGVVCWSQVPGSELVALRGRLITDAREVWELSLSLIHISEPTRPY